MTSAAILFGNRSDLLNKHSVDSFLDLSFWAS
jgi:hypothetical protein